MKTLRAAVWVGLVRVTIVATASMAVGAGAVGCATTSGPTSERLPDGSYRLKCNSSLARCLDRAEQVCLGNRFTVLGAVDQRDYKGGQGMEEVETRSSRAVIKCGTRGKSLFGTGEDPLPTLATAPVDKTAAPAATATTATRACVPGATQACIGPAACAGGQACLPDGAGFSACDCGGGAAGAAAPPAPASPVPGGPPAP